MIRTSLPIAARLSMSRPAEYPLSLPDPAHVAPGAALDAPSHRPLLLGHPPFGIKVPLDEPIDDLSGRRNVLDQGADLPHFESYSCSMEYKAAALDDIDLNIFYPIGYKGPGLLQYATGKPSQLYEYE